MYKLSDHKSKFMRMSYEKGDMMNKVTQVNLEYGMPTTDGAILKLRSSLTTAKGQGYKAVIIIHGYGSTGVGGKIKSSVIKFLSDNSMRGIVRTYVGGENWSLRKREILSICKDLESFDRTLYNNPGITVAILK